MDNQLFLEPCGQFYSRDSYTIFPHTGPKVPHSRPAPKRKYGIFGLDVGKNSIRSTGVKLASPQLVFATLAFGSGVNDKIKNTTFAFLIRERKWHFRPGYNGDK